jgi:hypothetical protein
MRYQRGLSLVAVAIAMGILAFVAALGLLSMRSDKNLFGEAWASLMKSAPVQQAQQATAAPPVPIRKCTIKGTVVYSNVECGTGAASSRAVDVQVTQGIEAPKAPPAPQASETGNELKDKAVERATR